MNLEVVEIIRKAEINVFITFMQEIEFEFPNSESMKTNICATELK